MATTEVKASSPSSNPSELDRSSEKDYVRVHDDVSGPRQQILRRDEYWDKKSMSWKLVEPKKAPEPEKLQKHVILVRRVFDTDMNPTRTEIDVSGPILRGTLMNIFRDSPGFPLTGRKRTVKPEWFYWAREDLRRLAGHCKDIDDQESLFEIEAGLLFVAEYHCIMLLELAQLSIKTEISCSDLWAIFAPHTLVYGEDVLGQERVWRVVDARIACRMDGAREFRIDAKYSEAAGMTVGTVSAVLSMPVYEGSVPIEALAYKPLYLLPERERIWSDLLARAEKQLSFLGPSYKIQEHEGECVVNGFADMPSWEPREPQRFYTRGRVMIDPIKYRAAEQAPLIPTINKSSDLHNEDVSRSTADGRRARTAPELLAESPSSDVDVLLEPEHDDSDPRLDHFQFDLSLGFTPPPPPSSTGNTATLLVRDAKVDEQKLAVTMKEVTEVDKVLLSGLLYGFSFADNRWAAFSINNVSDVSWRKDMLSSLVISASVLTYMRQLIQSHSSRPAFDDFVPGKGQGLIGLFSGQPGLGKTFTAEAIAETAEKALYSVSSGSLGSSASEINTKLRSIMSLCAHWQAVLLLDEADVFLAKRNIHDLKRNAIVSVFLRELEYYPGIMILTTNQPEIIDPAFQSRMHFCYRYPALDWRARRQVWLQFIEKAEAALGADRVHIDDAGLGALADLSYNGRQIKNAVSIAVALAGGKEGRVLSTESVLDVTSTLQAFDFSAPGAESENDDREAEALRVV